MRRIDIEIETERLRIEFPYDQKLVSTVKTLPQRRWDPGERAWFVPFDHIERVFDTLLDHHFKISRSLREFCKRNARPIEEILEGDGPSGPLPVPPGTLSISELNLKAQEALQQAFDESVWLVGELQSYDKNSRGGHAFFELVERPAENADPVARVNAVMWSGIRETVVKTLREASDDIRLRDGLAVRMRAEVDLYPQHGRYQVVVREIDPTYTTGRIQQKRQEILDALDEKGIREQNLQRDWAICPLRVGLLTSYESDAYNDFVEELRQSGYGFEVTVHDIYVQGDRTEESMLRGLRWFGRRAEQFDVLAVVRGGGARSDLAYFDTQKIGDAVCEHPIKMIAGIGHQRDECLLDHITESQKTPTAAGRTLVQRVGEFRDRMNEAMRGVSERAERRVERADERLRRVRDELRYRAERRLSSEERRLSSVRTGLTLAAKQRLGQARRRLDRADDRLPRVARAATEREEQRVSLARRQLRPRRLLARLKRERDGLDGLETKLEKVVTRRLDGEVERVDRLEEHLELLDPQRVLERGFAIVWKGEGGDDGRRKVVKSADEVDAGEELRVHVSDGEFEVERK